MRMPEFTAESSLSKASGLYRHTPRAALFPFGDGVIPQLFVWTGRRHCIPGCHCNNPVGCLCCSGFDYGDLHGTF